jgi:hypothetical protein
MRKVSMATRAELILAIRGRYASAGRPEKAKILDEFVALTGFHRKHAMRLLRGSDEPAKGGPRPARRIYGEAVRAALVLAWEASDRICGKRLHPLLPLLIEAMERHGHGGLDGQNRRQLLAMERCNDRPGSHGRQGERHGAAAAQGLNGDQTECSRSDILRLE